MMRILIICTDNSSRSQMTEGFLRKLLNNKVQLFSAGITSNVDEINRIAIEVMKEIGIDISKHTINSFREYRSVEFDHIISVCEDQLEPCPYYPSNAKIYHENIHDPSITGSNVETKNAFIIVREKIKNMCLKFIEENIPDYYVQINKFENM